MITLEDLKDLYLKTHYHLIQAINSGQKEKAAMLKIELTHLVGRMLDFMSDKG
jgi:hypothetical protein